MGPGTEETSAQKYAVTEAEAKMLENNFVYHSPLPGQNEKYNILRCNAKKLAYEIHVFVPPSRERSVAITKLEEAIFWANAGIARNE